MVLKRQTELTSKAMHRETHRQKQRTRSKILDTGARTINRR